MVEGIEKLRQLERVLGQVGGLGRGDALVNDVGRLGSGQPELPNFVAGFADEISLRDLRQKAGSPGSLPNSSGSKPPLRKILAARTTAYWAYGPVSPSKLSASLKSNAITDDLVNFSMK